MDRSILEVSDVRKTFATVNAVDGLSFDVRKGEIFALLGPNGAGKTTVVRMLMGIIRPEGGTIRWSLHSDVPTPPGQADLGYLPEERGLFKEVPILRTLAYFGVLHGMKRKQATRAAEEWLERLGLADRAREKLDSLSKGNQQKVQFISSILHRPAFAVLDEPFSGLDPVNQDAFLELLRELRDGGSTILLSAHQMELIERIADRLLLINQGRRVLTGSLDAIRSGARAGNKITLRVNDAAGIDGLRAHPSIKNAELTSEGELTLLVNDDASISDLLVTLGSTFEISGVHSERVSLHDIYVQAVKRSSGTDDNVGADR